MRLLPTSILLSLTLLSQSFAQLTFGPPSPLPSPINDGSFNWKPSISADNLTIYWASDRPGMGDLDIWTASRASTTDSWGEAVGVAAVNSSASESEPSVSADGLQLYFARGSSIFSRDSYDIWVSNRSSISEPWGDPEKLDSVVNGPTEEADPSISADGLELYFDSNRSGSFNIYVSRREARTEPFGTPAVALSSTGYANISSDGLMLFSSKTPDLAVSTRASINDSFGSPVLLDEINTGFNEFDGVLSADGGTLYFTSDRPGVENRRDFSGIWQAAVVPEPSTSVLAVFGLSGLLILRSRRNR